MAEMLVRYESDGNGIIYFGRENELLAIIAVSDPIKATSAEAVKRTETSRYWHLYVDGGGQADGISCFFPFTD